MVVPEAAYLLYVAAIGAYFAVRYTVLGGLGDLEGEEVIALGACASALV